MADDSSPSEVAAEFDQEHRFVRTPTVLWRQLARTVLLRTVTEPEIIELSGASVLLWLALAQPASAGELAADLSAVVGAPVEVVARDLGPVLTDLMQRGLVARLDIA
jgi:hypothetical protein